MKMSKGARPSTPGVYMRGCGWLFLSFTLKTGDRRLSRLLPIPRLLLCIIPCLCNHFALSRVQRAFPILALHFSAFCPQIRVLRAITPVSTRPIYLTFSLCPRLSGDFNIMDLTRWPFPARLRLKYGSIAIGPLVRKGGFQREEAYHEHVESSVER